ncbi:MAG: 5-formyltetrahydrofolate cyclo-ligase [Clostridiales bacterium]|nr:5-formyltetrahydrofolate cyclo-ligase [Clostridiales bacterium]
MTIKDIRPIKKKLREKYKNIRFAMTADEKARLDEKVFSRVVNSWAYRQQDIILTYVSTDIEVDTKAIIQRALQDGKTVAAPRCIDNTRLMDFYIIKSLDDLESGYFGVLEPKPEKCTKLSDFSKGLCIVPALCFDNKGYRLGYGKGYYDRFLVQFEGEIMGICYSSCVCESLPYGKYDRNVDILITEKTCINLKKDS